MFLNDNGISVAGLGLFSTIIVMVGTVLVELIRTRHKVNDTKQVAESVVQQTAPISNGFARDMRNDVAEVRRLVMLVMDSQVEMRKDVGSLSRRLDTHIADGKED